FFCIPSVATATMIASRVPDVRRRRHHGGRRHAGDAEEAEGRAPAAHWPGLARGNRRVRPQRRPPPAAALLRPSCSPLPACGGGRGGGGGGGGAQRKKPRGCNPWAWQINPEVSACIDTPPGGQSMPDNGRPFAGGSAS